MRPRTLLIAALVLLGGCSGFATFGDDTGTAAGTVTPVPVPSPETRHLNTTETSVCVAPPPQHRPGTPLPEATGTDAYPTINGTVPGSAIVDRHTAALPRYRYHLRAGPDYEVWSLPNHSAFTYEGTIPRFFDLEARVYAVGGTLYRFYRSQNETELWIDPFRPAMLQERRYLPSLTARDRLEWAIGRFNYTRTGERELNGTTVRVFTARFNDSRLVEGRQIYELDSRVYVDGRGIVRTVVHVERFNYATEVGKKPHVWRFSLNVTDLGTARIHRPEVFCEQPPDAVPTTTPVSGSATSEEG